MTTDYRQTERDVPPKAMLSCPDCGHQNRLDGDWNRGTTASDTRYLCPECETEIVRRPDRSPDTPSFPDLCQRMWRTGQDGFRAWQNVWR